MKKSIWLAVALAATVAVGGILTLQAQDGSGGPARWRQRGWANAKEKLGLTDAQVAQIKTELRAEKATLTELALKLHDAKIVLRRTINKTGATEAEVRAAATQLGAAEGDLAVLKAKLHARISPLLTPEQLAKILVWQEKVDDFVDGAIQTFINRMVE